MRKVHDLEYALDALRILADNEYSLLWDLVEDFEVNGHKISVKSSNQFKSVIIDGKYEKIGGNMTIVANGKTYTDPIDYVRDLLKDPKNENESETINFGSGSKKEIREAIANKASLMPVNESDTIKVFNRGSDEYEKLDAAAHLISAFTGKDFYVGETYFDYGQGWKWTTILGRDYQLLSPRDQENIVTAKNAQELGKAVDKVLNTAYIK